MPRGAAWVPDQQEEWPRRRGPVRPPIWVLTSPRCSTRRGPLENNLPPKELSAALRKRSADRFRRTASSAIDSPRMALSVPASKVLWVVRSARLVDLSDLLLLGGAMAALLDSLWAGCAGMDKRRHGSLVICSHLQSPVADPLSTLRGSIAYAFDRFFA